MTELTNWVAIGPELQVNYPNLRAQDQSVLTALSDGRFLAVYRNDYASGDHDIWLRVINTSGDLVGNGNSVAFSGFDEILPAVAATTSGGAGIVWQTSQSLSGAATGTNIFFRPYNATTDTLGTTLQVANRSQDLVRPDIATFGNGKQIIVYESDISLGNHDIRAAIVNAAGTAVIKADFLFADGGNHTVDSPKVAASGNRALVVFNDKSISATADIRANLYNVTNGAGAGHGRTFTLASSKTLTYSVNDVAALKGGRFVVMFSDADHDKVFACVFDPSTYNAAHPGATRVPNHFMISAGGNGGSVAATPDGGFIATWSENVTGESSNIFERRYDKYGHAVGDVFTVNVNVDQGQYDSSVAVNKSGRTMNTWTDLGTRTSDGAPSGVRGQFGQVSNETFGSGAADVFHGYGIAEKINGLGGADRIFGKGGNDTLEGAAGGDLLVGGMGRDLMSGGPDNDTFDFNSIKESVKGANRDRILDFSRAEGDRIDLSTIDANTHAPGNQAFHWIGGQAFHSHGAHHVYAELRYQNHIVSGDVNGDGKADFEIWVNAASLAKGDFIL